MHNKHNLVANATQYGKQRFNSHKRELKQKNKIIKFLKKKKTLEKYETIYLL